VAARAQRPASGRRGRPSTPRPLQSPRLDGGGCSGISRRSIRRPRRRPARATPASTTSAPTPRSTASRPEPASPSRGEDECVTQLGRAAAPRHGVRETGWSARRGRGLPRRAERAPREERGGVLSLDVSREGLVVGTCAIATWPRHSTRSVAHLDRQVGRAKVVVWAHNSHVGDAASDRDGAAGRAQHRPARARAVRPRGDPGSASPRIMGPSPPHPTGAGRRSASGLLPARSDS